MTKQYVKCINVDENTYLTLNKEYILVENDKYCYYIISNCGNKVGYFKYHFTEPYIKEEINLNINTISPDIAIHCTTEEESVAVVKIVNAAGKNFFNPKHLPWKHYANNLVINFKDSSIFNSHINSDNTKRFTIIPAAEFIKANQSISTEQQIENLQKQLDELKQSVRKSLFKTEDGKDVYIGDLFHIITAMNNIVGIIANNYSGRDSSVKYFSSYKKAEEWLETNKSKSETITIGSNHTCVVISKKSIKVGFEDIDVLRIKTLIGQLTFNFNKLGKYSVYLDKNARFISIGCSEFSLNELQQVVDIYNKLNS